MRSARPSRLVWLAPLVGLVLLVPFVAEQSAWKEWTNYLWLVQRQQAAIAASGHPSLFLHEDFGVFYPQYAFYGATLWAATGALSELVGSSWSVFVAMLVGAYAVAYASTWWVAREVGLGPVLAHAPALALVTTPYATGVLYARGDWAEVIATSAVPLALAGCLAVMRTGDVGPGPLAAIAVATAVISGSHGITLVWGTIVAAAIVIVGLVATSGVRVASRWRRLGLAALAAALGVAVNLWFLLPQAAYARDTDVFRQFHTGGLTVYNALGVVFSPYPRLPAGDPRDDPFYAQAPVLVLAWGLAAGALARRRKVLWRWWCGLVVVLVVLFVLLTSASVFDALPYALRSVQFSVRFETYIGIAATGLAVVGLAAARGAPRRAVWTGALGVAVTWQVAVALWTVFANAPVERFHVRDVRPDQVVSPFSGYQTQGFKLRSGGPLVARPRRRIAVDRQQALRGPVGVALPAARPGERFATNVIWSPLVESTGAARIVGRDGDGFAVLEAQPGAGSEPAVAVVRGARPWPVRLGLVGTLAAAAALAALLISRAPATRRRRRRRSRRRRRPVPA